MTIYRGVQWGCLIAPYLYLVADVLGLMLTDPKYGIEGHTLLIAMKLIQQLFASDTTLFLKGTRENVEKVYMVLELFCKGSGTSIDWHRNSAIWTSGTPHTFQ